MTSENIRHKEVIIVDYDPQWIGQYKQQVDVLKHLLGSVLIRSHHIGSTSVPGLAAKPVVDILLEITSVEDFDNLQEKLIESGYQFWGDYGIPGRRYITLGTDPRKFNIHSFESHSPEIQHHLAFRNHLRNNSEVAREYEALKRKVAAGCNHDIEKYCKGKDGFIKNTLRHLTN